MAKRTTSNTVRLEHANGVTVSVSEDRVAQLLDTGLFTESKAKRSRSGGDTEAQQ
jgi:hypothetical protein